MPKKPSENPNQNGFQQTNMGWTQNSIKYINRKDKRQSKIKHRA